MERKMGALIRVLRSVVVGLAALAGGFAFAVDLPGPLVDTKWLAANLKETDLVVLDVRVEKDLKAFGFIPGSREWDWDSVRVDRTVDGVALESIVPTREQFEALMKKLGVGNGNAVVIAALSHNPSSFTMGTRAYWTFKYFGHDKVAILDGGVAKWAAEKRETMAAAQPPVKAGDFRVREVRSNLLALTPDVVSAVQKKDVQLVDGRTAEFYLGEKKKDYVYAKGHIPGAKLVPNPDIMDPKSYTFRSVAELKEVFAKNGVDPMRPAITYCDSGHLSTGAWFVAHELLGNEKVRLYDGSMHEWTKDAKRPVTTSRE